MSLEARLEKLEKRLQEAEDLLAITKLLSTYGPAVDSGACREAAQLWVEDGAYDVGGLHRAEGRTAIASLYEAEAHQTLIHQGSAHLTSTPRITLDGDAAEAVAYSFVVLRNDEDWGVWRASANRWALRRTAEGWRIVERFNRTLDGSEASHAILRVGLK